MKAHAHRANQRACWVPSPQAYNGYLFSILVKEVKNVFEFGSKSQHLQAV